MTEHELFRKTFSTLHASPDTLMEVQKAMENNKKTHRTLRRGVVIAIAAALMLTVARKIPYYNDKIKIERIWNHTSFELRPLREMTVFLVGFGKIARLTATHIKPLFGRVIAYDPYADRKAAAELGVEIVESLEEGLRQL